MSSLPETVQVGEWRVEPELDVIVRSGRATKIEPRAMRVLLCLIARPGHIVSVRELLEEVWPDVVVGPDSVYQAIALLRRTLGDDSHHPVYIAHVPRKGYRLVAPVSAPTAAAAAANASTSGSAANDGLRVASAVAAPIAPRARAKTSRLSRALLCAALAVTIATLGGLYLLVRNARAPSSAAPLRLATVEFREAPHPAHPAPPSIAVLPFLDMSEKQDLGYFADGLTEELIDLLSRGSGLRVPARTSSFYFKGKSTTVREIASALDVDSLLEGSVRRSGKRVRVTAQLIRADSGYHLWSQTYDRDFTEIFEVEDDIARAVAHALQAKLNAGHTTAEGVATNGEAHNLQLQCQFFIQRNTKADAGKAVACYRQLLALAPEDAVAWAGYAEAVWRQPVLTRVSLPELRTAAAAARQAAQHAILLDPGLAAPHALISVYHRVIDRDWAAANTEIEAALTAEPDDPSSLLAASRLAMTLGQFDRALAFLERARLRDPLNFLPYTRLAIIYLYEERLPEAEANVRRELDVGPEAAGGHELLGAVLLARGLRQPALEAIEQEHDEEIRLRGFARAYYALGRRAESDAALSELMRKYPHIHPTHTAEVYAFRGETDRAFSALDEAFASGDTDLPGIKSDSYFKPLRADARYRALLKKLNLPEHGPD